MVRLFAFDTLGASKVLFSMAMKQERIEAVQGLSSSGSSYWLDLATQVERNYTMSAVEADRLILRFPFLSEYRIK